MCEFKLNMDQHDEICEPLNLTIKKRPVAVVAPSAIIGTKCPEPPSPEDLSPKRNNAPPPVIGDCLDLSMVSNKYNKNETLSNYLRAPIPHQQLHSYIGKDASVYEKNLFNEEKRLYEQLKGQGAKAAYKTSESLYDTLASSPENLYSVINTLAEHKFLAALYMNSLLTQGMSPYGLQCGTPLNNQPPLLNNLLDAHRLSAQLFRDADKNLNIDTAIKNKVNVCDSANSKPASTTPPLHQTPSPSPSSLASGDYTKRTSVDQKNSTGDSKNNQDSNNSVDKKKPHIKKPLNAFMLYMKEMRAKVVAECTLKESAAINQILGRRWHSLSREEQAKYYEKARQERQLHMQLYPGWSARDNYGYGTKKKKRKKERTPVEPGGNSMKKCRARYGLDQQSQWCKPCRRKKKCIRYMESGDSNDGGNQSDDNLGSCGSVGDAHTPPDDDAESLTQSLSSPGGLSGLSSLTSPSMILPSPSTSLASPSLSLASPCMSLQSPLTPHDGQPPPPPPAPAAPPPPQRNPVGTNPHDINNPLSVNQLTGQCVKSEPGASGSSSKDSAARPVISVT